MKTLMDICELVPGWLYAIAVAVLGGLLIFGEIDRNSAITEAALAGQALAEIKAMGAAASASSIQLARGKEAAANVVQLKVVDELNKATSNPDARVADLERRMRNQATTYAASSCRCMPPGASASAVSDGSRGAGIRGVDAADLVVLDSQAQREIAELVVSANNTGKTLTACRRLLLRDFELTN